MSSNLFVMTGRLGRDAEYRAFPNGGGVISFSVATNSGYGDRQKTLWVRANVFGKRAESKIKDYLLKGQEVFLTGELSESEYESNGQQKKTLELNVDKLELIGGSPSQQQQPQQAPQPASPQAGADYGQGEENYYDDDIPF